MSKTKPTPPPCLRIKIGAAEGAAGTQAGCQVAGTGPNQRRYRYDLREKLSATTKSVDFLDKKKCGKDKHGKLKDCPKPCAAWSDQPKTNKKGKVTPPRCPIQLAFDAGQPFLRFCRAKGAGGFQVPVNNAAQAQAKAIEACTYWHKHKSFEGFFPKDTPLRGAKRPARKRR
jgi:hypothetical protein